MRNGADVPSYLLGPNRMDAPRVRREELTNLDGGLFFVFIRDWEYFQAKNGPFYAVPESLEPRWAICRLTERFGRPQLAIIILVENEDKSFRQLDPRAVRELVNRAPWFHYRNAREWLRALRAENARKKETVLNDAGDKAGQKAAYYRNAALGIPSISVGDYGGREKQ